MIDKKKQIVANGIVVALVSWSGCLVFAQEAKDLRQSDPYYKAHGGWEIRPLQSARKQGKLVFQSDFSAAGLKRDWKADGVSVELKSGSAILSVSPERLTAKQVYGVLWAKAAFAQPMMIEVEFSLDRSTPHDANVFWGQKTPSSEHLGKEQECYIMGYFGWGGRVRVSKDASAAATASPAWATRSSTRGIGAPGSSRTSFSASISTGHWSFARTLQRRPLERLSRSIRIPCHWALQNQPPRGASKPASSVHAW